MQRFLPDATTGYHAPTMRLARAAMPVCESAAYRTTVQRVEAKELSRVVGDKAAGIPSLLSGRRKTYKPKHKLYGLLCDSLSSFIN